jgi:hypothetical protein
MPSPNGNTETVSEKKRRGRPPAFDAGFDAAVRAGWGDLVLTKRSFRNKGYLTRAIRVVRPDGKLNERYRWFAGEGKSFRQAVLVELGRIAVQLGDATAVTMADRLADIADEGELTTTRAAAACLRRARLSLAGKPSEASADALERLIITMIDGYLDQHPDATAALVQEALLGASRSAGRWLDDA